TLKRPPSKRRLGGLLDILGPCIAENNNTRRPSAFRMAATTAGSKYEQLKFTAATKALRAPLDRRRKHTPDRWDRSRLHRSRCGEIRRLETRSHYRHDRSLGPPLFL